LQIELPGYQKESTKLEILPGAPTSINLALQVLPQTVRLYTDLQSGSVQLDGNGVGELQSGELVLDSLLPGKHQITVEGGKSQVSLSVESTPGSLPLLNSPVSAKELKVVVFTNLGAEGRVYTSFGPVPVQVDGRSLGDVGPDGAGMGNLTAGSHEVLVGEGEDLRKIVFEVGEAPTVTAYMSSDRNAGTLVVVTGEDNVRVLVNGRAYRRKTQGGRLRIPNLDVRSYEIQVVKEGFEAAPPQRAEIRKGIETQLVFRMTPAPTVATLQIEGAAPGAQVLLGRKPLGNVRDDGSFSASGIMPGEHVVEIRNEGFRPKHLARNFAAGQTIRLSGDDVVMESARGVLHINASPQDARITIALVGDPQAQVVQGTTLNLTEGNYILRATAPEHAPASVSVRIVAGETKTVALALTSERKAEAVWENASAWTRDGNWQLKKGGGVSLFGASPTAGRFVFTIMLRKGKRLQWVLNYLDDHNYALFQADKKTFTRSVVRNGSTRELAKVAIPIDYKGYYTIQVRVTPGSVMHEIFDGKSWASLDSWTDPGMDVTQGKFGVLVQGSDVVGISNFAFYPR